MHLDIRRTSFFLALFKAKAVINHLEGHYKLMAPVMYGSGLRLSEVSRLRIQDIDFANNCIVAREAKGDVRRRTLLPTSIEQPLERQIFFALQLHEQDIDDGFGEVYLPSALNRKYPNAAKEAAWQYLFPADNLSIDPRSNKKRRHHIGVQQIQRSVKTEIKGIGICHLTDPKIEFVVIAAGCSIVGNAGAHCRGNP